MDDIVDDDVAIRVEPTDVQAIREAIRRLRDDPELCARLSEASLQRIKRFDINDRAGRILNWMLEMKPQQAKEVPG